jgi:alanine dehydrogenase
MLGTDNALSFGSEETRAGRALKLANKGFRNAVKSDPGLAAGVNTFAGKLTYESVAISQGRYYTPLDHFVLA